MASFLPHFLSLDCCLATFSQKFCLLSGRVKRHSLHSLLSHLAHTVASTVELFNSTGFLTHIMIFLGNNYFHACSFSISFSNHYISIRISRAPSLRACSSLMDKLSAGHPGVGDCATSARLFAAPRQHRIHRGLFSNAVANQPRKSLDNGRPSAFAS